MEDFLKFLLIAGVILVGIFKEVNKNSKSKKAQNKRPVPPMSSPTEIDPDVVPMPEAWGRGKSLDELFPPASSYEPTVAKPAAKPISKPVAQPTSKSKKKKEEVSVAASLANSAAQDERNTRQGSHYNTPHESPNEQDFTIHSAEEARRAIIWGEILQRKY